MKTLAIITAFLSGPTFGTVLPKLESDEVHFVVHNFTASCVPHSLSCAMEFIVLTGPNTAASRCSFWGPGPDILPQIPLTACSNLNVSFSFGRQQAYYPLSITESLAPGQNRTGTYQIPQYDVAVEDHGSVDTERYEGPSDLTVSNVTTVSF